MARLTRLPRKRSSSPSLLTASSSVASSASSASLKALPASGDHSPSPNSNCSPWNPESSFEYPIRPRSMSCMVASLLFWTSVNVRWRLGSRLRNRPGATCRAACVTARSARACGGDGAPGSATARRTVSPTKRTKLLASSNSLSSGLRPSNSRPKRRAAREVDWLSDTPRPVPVAAAARLARWREGNACCAIRRSAFCRALANAGSTGLPRAWDACSTNKPTVRCNVAAPWPSQGLGSQFQELGLVEDAYVRCRPPGDRFQRSGLEGLEALHLRAVLHKWMIHVGHAPDRALSNRCAKRKSRSWRGNRRLIGEARFTPRPHQGSSAESSFAKSRAGARLGTCSAAEVRGFRPTG